MREPGRRSHASHRGESAWGLRRGPWVAALLGLGLSLRPGPAPATIEDQRSRLPPPAFDCGGDPIVGVWQAHAYYAHVRQWYRFELTIEHDPDASEAGRLRGSIRSEFWDGGPERAEPPTCASGVDRSAVIERATGRHDGLTLELDAVDWRDLEACGPHPGGYLLDHFAGTVDPERMEFQSLLNADAPEWRDVPTVFRRVRCGPAPAGDEAEEPRVRVAPPPYEPPDERGGCGLRDTPRR